MLQKNVKVHIPELIRELNILIKEISANKLSSKNKQNKLVLVRSTGPFSINFTVSNIEYRQNDGSMSVINVKSHDVACASEDIPIIFIISCK